MTYKYILSAFLTSVGVIGAIAPVAVAQERPKCYLIEPSGELTNLTNLCNASTKRSPDTEPATNEELNVIDNNSNVIGFEPLATELAIDDSVYFLGEDNLPLKLSSIASAYYINNEIGMDYTAYIRRYPISPTFIPRQSVKEQVFQFDVDVEPNNLTSILRRKQSRTPFIIYRYPARR